VTCLDEEGRVIDVDVAGFTARVIQHEVDHLNGVLFIDRMSTAKRFTLANKLRRLRDGQRGEEE
jgi:peptide deformylase